MKKTHIMVENMFMVYNTMRSESTLKKKSNSITFHFMRESAGDMLLKSQSGPERKQLAQMVLK